MAAPEGATKLVLLLETISHSQKTVLALCSLSSCSQETERGCAGVLVGAATHMTAHRTVV